MASTKRWEEAQAAEGEFWSGISLTTAQEAVEVYRVTATLLQSWLPDLPSPALEVGIGGLGVGLIGFLDSISVRIGTDPLPLIDPSWGGKLLDSVLALRKPLQFVRASGESLPFPDQFFGLAVCSNVLDHVADAAKVLNEIFRVLRPGGLLFLKVDIFSYLGLAKWYVWTERVHAKEILVRAHPYRFTERRLERMCQAAGFKVVQTIQQDPVDRWIGHSMRATFLLRKPGAPPSVR